jgi:Fic family protein
MVSKGIEGRVLTLEQQMSELREIPARVSRLESNISQLRAEMRDEFSAIRGEMATLGDTLRGEMAAGFGAVRDDMATFRADMIAGDEETRRHARMLHEDLVGRIALIQEDMPRRTNRKKSR